MGKQISSLSVALNATVAPFASALKGAEGAVHGLAGVVSGGFGAITHGAGGLVSGAGAAGVSLLRLSGIGAAVAAGFAAVTEIGKGFKFSETLEKTQLQFAALIGDSGKAKTAIEDIGRVPSPFEFPDLLNAGRELLAFGVSNKNLIPSLSAIGDVAAGVGQPLGEVVRIFGMVAETGKLSERELRQFGKAGIPVVDELAKRFGVTHKEIDAMATAGTIGFGDLQAVFQKMSGPEGKFFGQGEKQSKMFGRMMNNLGDAVEMGLAKTASVIVDVFGLKGGVEAATGAVERVGAAFNDGLAYVGPILVRWATATYQAFAGIWTRVEPTVSGIWRGIKAAWDIVVGVVETRGPAIWQSVKSTWDVVYGYVSDVAGKIWKYVSDHWEGMVETSVTYGMALWNFVSSAWGAIKDLAVWAWDGITKIWTWGHNLITGESDTGASSISKIWNDVVGVFRWVQDSVSLVFNTLSYVFKNWREGLEIIGLGAALAVVTFANQVEYFFTDVIPGVIDWFADNWRTIFTDLWSFTATVMGNLEENVVNVFTNMPELIAGTMDFSEVWEPLTAGFRATLKKWPQIADRQMGGLEKDLYDQLNIKGGDFGDGLGKYLAEQEGKSKDVSKGIVGNLKSAFATIREAFGAKPPELQKPKIPTPDPLKTRLDPDTLSVSIAPSLKTKAIFSGSAESQALQFAVPRGLALAAAGAPPLPPMPPVKGNLPPMDIPNAWKGGPDVAAPVGPPAVSPAPRIGPDAIGARGSNAGDVGGANGRIVDPLRQILYWIQRTEQNTRQPTDPSVVSIA